MVLQNLNNKMKFLQKDVDRVLLQIGALTRTFLVTNWLKGKGGDKRSMRRLTNVYKKRKIKLGREGKPDLHLSGNMAGSLEPKKAGKNKVIVTFSQQEMGKARSNFARRKNMMKLAKSFKKDMVNFFFKKLKEV